MKRIVTRALIVLAATLGIVFAQIALASATAASAPRSSKLESNLAALWTTVLETPSAQNSFGTGGSAFGCWDLGGTVAPLAPSGVESCTVKPGTKLFVAGFTVECSTFEGHGTTEAELRTCARESDLQVAPTVTLDGRSVPIAEAETPLLSIVLPAGNLFGAPAGTSGLSVGHGWVALLHPLPPGTHTIVIGGTIPTTTTTIVVKPGLHAHKG
jgi:hypothetical protein